MRILISAIQAPFLTGGGELHITGLRHALQLAGHDVELLRIPFKFSPLSDVERAMRFCDGLDLSTPNGQSVDRVISLQFPAYGVAHPDKIVWLMHQHRAVYELYNPAEASPELAELRECIYKYDNRVLSQARVRFANSARVAQRLSQYNGLTASPLYHPPAGMDTFYCSEALDYVFFPSRLERLKRQDLLIEAATLWRAPVVALIGGVGGQKGFYQQLIERLQVLDKVRLIGEFSEAEKRVLYARSLAVVFPPFDEDLGYITLEAMLSAKPVITCRDSGGPLEFVQHGETGLVVEPTPQAIANAVDELYANRQRTREMGQAGLAAVRALDLSWNHVVTKLLSA